MKKERVLAVVDLETDPFDEGRAVFPFALGFFDGSYYRHWWGDDCIEKFFEFLDQSNTKYLIYAHNGGKFDYYFMLKYFDEKCMFIKGRIVKWQYRGNEFRDSFAVLPVPLKKLGGTHNKKEIDYAKMTKDRREAHKSEILEYLKYDCFTLHSAIEKFREMFGDYLTIGMLAMTKLKELHEFQKGNEFYDRTLRPFFFGGRNQAFETGIIRGDFKLYDVNSMYPYVMRKYKHPVSIGNKVCSRITSRTAFAIITARNDNALPTRQDDFRLSFLVRQGIFMASIHEIEAAEELGLLKIESVHEAYEFDESSSFSDFVDTYNMLKIEAERTNDKLGRTFYKLLMNSAYGKFAQNPADYEDFRITQDSVEPSEHGWNLLECYYDVFLWSRPSPRKTGYNNVATAASITGAARAELLRGIAASANPLYCDTDSVIATSLSAPLDNDRLGAWKIEANASLAAIAGRKTYCLMNGDVCVKSASKGVQLTPREIIDVAGGATIEKAQQAPTFSLRYGQRKLVRKIRMTG